MKSVVRKTGWAVPGKDELEPNRIDAILAHLYDKFLRDKLELEEFERRVEFALKDDPKGAEVSLGFKLESRRV